MILSQSPWIWFIPVFVVLILIVTVVAICICKWPHRKYPRNVDPRIILKDVNHVEVISNPGIPVSPSMRRQVTSILEPKFDPSKPPQVPLDDPPPLPSRLTGTTPDALTALPRSKSRKNQLRLVDDDHVEATNFSTMIPDITVLDMDVNDRMPYGFDFASTETERDKLLLH